jgi:hypothetical protein
MSQLGQKPKLPRNINGRFNSINGHNAAKLPVLPTAEALSPPAATTLASKGRLIHWTLPGSTPNRAANQLRLWPRPRNCATAGSSRTRFRCGLRVSSPTIARPCAVNARPSGLPSRSPSRHASRSAAVPPPAGRSSSLWHNGGNVGFRSLYVGDPVSGNGMAAMTNGDKGEEVCNALRQRGATAYGWR